ncbi:MAG: hypothetical protein SP4CHLAM5_07670 [Chlamydiia bacterium]|nr:hypothetical protein [Chlamydiia bacterium]MCH9618632.1 hypothetical protein [Chlamydiia bacterium]MCH9623823.1 hypothetical protein [Chlamydiia bacterium]
MEVCYCTIFFLQDEYKLKFDTLFFVKNELCLATIIGEIERAKKGLDEIINKFSGGVAYLVDRNNPVAELLYNGMIWSEINHENMELEVQFYTHQSNRPWEFSLDSMIDNLNWGRNALLKHE